VAFPQIDPNSISIEVVFQNQSNSNINIRVSLAEGEHEYCTEGNDSRDYEYPNFPFTPHNIIVAPKI
jgi:hypothetical protein